MIHFTIVEKKKPGTQDFKFYGQIVQTGVVGIRELCQLIADKCTLTPADVLATLNALQTEIINQLKQGNSVRMGDLGSFRPTLSSEGATSADAWAVSMIKKVRAVYTPSAEIKHQLSPKRCAFAKA